jgi:hypothetical protein
MSVRPSTKVLQQACQLGMQMAKRDRRIIAILSGAHQYTTYVQFITAHRYRLEGLTAFEPWDRALHKLAEDEGLRLGLKPDDHRQWDTYLNQVFTPIRCSFWYGWESVFNLRKLYDEQIALAQRDVEQPTVLRVFNPPVSPLIPSSPLPDRFYEEKEWDQIAREMDLQASEEERKSELPKT